MSNSTINTWLNPVVLAYERIYGQTEKPVVWEVGSRDGRDGVELARRIYKGHPDWFWTNARVVLFEPNPMQAEIIRAEYPEAELIQKAASDASGTADFMVYEGDEGAIGSSSLDLKWKDGSLEGNIIQVETVRLDELIGDESIDIMKIDVEGKSFEVMQGLGEKLKNVCVYHIETEKWTDSNLKVKGLMLSAGYTLVDETEQYGGMPDQVWVR